MTESLVVFSQHHGAFIGNLPASHYASMKLVGKSHHHFAASCWARAVAGLRGVNKDLTARGGAKI